MSEYRVRNFKCVFYITRVLCEVTKSYATIVLITSICVFVCEDRQVALMYGTLHIAPSREENKKWPCWIGSKSITRDYLGDRSDWIPFSAIFSKFLTKYVITIDLLMGFVPDIVQNAIAFFDFLIFRLDSEFQSVKRG